MSTKTKKSLKGMGGNVFTIYPKRKDDKWVFDDEDRGLFTEDFLLGNIILDMLGINGNKCTVMFSEDNFPDHHIELILREFNEGGSYYYNKKLRTDVFISNVLYKYFKSPPHNIFIRVKK